MRKKITNYLINGLTEINGIEIYIPENLENHIGIVSFNIEGYKPEEIGQILSDEYGICVRTGHHCASFVGNFMEGMAENGSARVSVGYFNSEDDVNTFIDSIIKL
jgi:selenocysteine lyase/cysteine desulfurase